MISIYQAANLADAYLIRHLLEEERIDAYIAGEYLRGAIGEIPANTPIEVRVSAEDAARARRIVEEWERSPIDTSAFEDEADAVVAGPTETMRDPTQRPQFRVFAAIVWLITGAALGAGAMWAAQNGPRSESGVDYNDDGAIDERWMYAGDRPERVEIDRNRDGKPDFILDYDDRALPSRDEVDRDFNGTMEESTAYRYGQPMRTELDRDRDGRIEYRAEYIHGTIFREEWLNPNGDTIKRVEYDRGDPSEGAIDSDGDGRLDTARVYDSNGEIVRTAPLDAR
ncbi:MAG: DUF2007 domain-containing protein [Xanthomonadaceae bacterium]|nr:DUF2007 domain-containing protein [Xanthomonadaceae bacterium]